MLHTLLNRVANNQTRHNTPSQQRVRSRSASSLRDRSPATSAETETDADEECATFIPREDESSAGVASGRRDVADMAVVGQYAISAASRVYGRDRRASRTMSHFGGHGCSGGFGWSHQTDTGPTRREQVKCLVLS